MKNYDDMISPGEPFKLGGRSWQPKVVSGRCYAEFVDLQTSGLLMAQRRRTSQGLGMRNQHKIVVEFLVGTETMFRTDRYSEDLRSKLTRDWGGLVDADPTGLAELADILDNVPGNIPAQLVDDIITAQMPDLDDDDDEEGAQLDPLSGSPASSDSGDSSG